MSAPCRKHASGRAWSVLCLVAQTVVVFGACTDDPTDPEVLEGGALVTFAAGEEEFVVWLEDPETGELALEIASGAAPNQFPIGPVRRGSGPGSHNAP